MTTSDRSERLSSAAHVEWALFALVVTAGAFLIYRHTLTAHLVGDDIEAILWSLGSESVPTANPHVRWVTLAALRANYEIGGVDPLGYHLVSVGLHAMNCVLVAAVASRLLQRAGAVVDSASARRIGLVAGMVFLTLATHTEAVSWVVIRSDEMATLGCLVALWVWLRDPVPSRAAIAVALVAFALALFAKESAAPLPFIVFAWSLGVDGSRIDRAAVRRAVRASAPFAGVLAVFLVVRRLHLGTVVGIYGASDGYDTNPIRGLGRLVVLSLRTIVPAMGPAGWAVSVGVLAGLVVLVYLARAQLDLRPWATAAASPAVATVLAVAPAAGLGVSMSTTLGERFLYVGSAFAAITLAVVLGAAWIGSPRPALRAATAVIGATVILAGAWGATVLDARWREAADLAELVLEDQDMWATPHPVYVLNPPDHLRGAIAMRNAIGGASLLFHHWPDPDLVTEVVPLEFRSRDDRVALEPTSRARTWRLVLISPGMRFAGVPGGSVAWDVEGFTVEQVAPRAVDVTIARDIDLRSVWVVSGGRIHPMRS